MISEGDVCSECVELLDEPINEYLVGVLVIETAVFAALALKQLLAGGRDD